MPARPRSGRADLVLARSAPRRRRGRPGARARTRQNAAGRLSLETASPAPARRPAAPGGLRLGRRVPPRRSFAAASASVSLAFSRHTSCTQPRPLAVISAPVARLVPVPLAPPPLPGHSTITCVFPSPYRIELIDLSPCCTRDESPICCCRHFPSIFLLVTLCSQDWPCKDLPGQHARGPRARAQVCNRRVLRQKAHRRKQGREKHSCDLSRACV